MVFCPPSSNRQQTPPSSNLAQPTYRRFSQRQPTKREMEYCPLTRGAGGIDMEPVMTFEEIGAALGVPKQTVYQDFRRAIYKLQHTTGVLALLELAEHLDDLRSLHIDTHESQEF